MVPTGEKLPHQLLGAPGSFSDLHERSNEQASPASAGQSDSSCIYKQFGRDSLRPSNVNCQKPLDVVPGEGYSTVRATSPRKGEYRSRLGVESDEGSLRLDAERVGFSSSSDPFSLPERRLVRVPVDRSASEVLQLETRPNSGGYRRVSPGLERSVRLCQSSLELDRESPLEGGGAAGGRDTGSTSVANSTLVSQAPQSAGCGSMPSAGAGMGRAGGVPPRAPPSTGRVAYLRQHYVNQKLSGEASDLLLSSWRQKSAQSYDSLCKKWISWCSERNSDPVSGPVEDVVNFLAHLHTQGYQYRSLNSYTSAIASLHTPIDGVSIGQHPLVSRLLKVAFQTRPPLPRYTETWDVAVVLSYLDSQSVDENLSLKLLSNRTVMLLALSRPSRSADLSKLDLRGYRNTPEGAVFLPTALAKQSRPGKPLTEFFFSENRKLCPVFSLDLYSRLQ